MAIVLIALGVGVLVLAALSGLVVLGFYLLGEPAGDGDFAVPGRGGLQTVHVWRHFNAWMREKPRRLT